MFGRPDSDYGGIIYIYIYMYIYIYQIVGKRTLKSFQKCAVILCAPHVLYPLEHSSSGRDRCSNERAYGRRVGMF